MSNAKKRYVWLDGELVPWADAKLHVNTQCVLGGLNAYEVVQGHWLPDREEMYLFRFSAHMRRLEASQKVMRIQPPYSPEALLAATRQLIRANGHREDVQVRLVVYLGEGPLFAYGAAMPAGAFIFSYPAVRHTPADRPGVRCGTVTWERASDLAVPPRVKAGANYQNLRLAAIQAQVNGYDIPIMLNREGKVTEAHLRNLFIVRDGILISPAAGSAILEGITRMTVLEVAARELGLPVQEREVDKTELLVADEVFLTGSFGDEIVPVLEVDGYTVGDGLPGPVTGRLAAAMREVTAGSRPGYADWLHPVYAAT